MRTAPFSLLVKPAGADCNITCDYCFYRAKAGLYPEVRHPRMSVATAERTMEQLFTIPMPSYGFGWQGGEPTLMGADWFAEVLDRQQVLHQRLAPPGAPVTNGLQTNGTLLDAERWAPLLRRHNVLVGLSLDGPQEIHNSYRHHLTHRGTHAEVEAAARMLREEKVEYNVLVVVGRHNQDHAVEVYEYLRTLRVRYMQFIPLLEFNAAGEREPYSVTPEGWGRFLNAIFRRWFPRDVRRVSVRHHDSLIELLATGRHNVCTTSGSCGGHIVVEHSGDLYPCDFFVERERRLGSVHDTDSDNPLKAAADSDAYRRFSRREGHALPAACATCEYLSFCHGDCPKLRTAATDEPARAALCDGWRAWYDEVLPDARRLASSLR